MAYNVHPTIQRRGCTTVCVLLLHTVVTTGGIDAPCEALSRTLFFLYPCPDRLKPFPYYATSARSCLFSLPEEAKTGGESVNAFVK